ncbi:MAG TPA: OB-fold domain-containing protein [Acidimicrobiales bacterium]
MTALLEPPVGDASGPFWDATRDQRLVLPWCTACDAPFWYPREVCPRCLSPDVTWRPARGDGVVYAVSAHHRPGPGRDPADGPYAVALVDLAEGVRIMGNVVGVPADDVAVGAAVHVTWLPLSDGRHLPQFTPG